MIIISANLKDCRRPNIRSVVGCGLAMLLVIGNTTVQTLIIISTLMSTSSLLVVVKDRCKMQQRQGCFCIVALGVHSVWSPCLSLLIVNLFFALVFLFLSLSSSVASFRHVIFTHSYLPCSPAYYHALAASQSESVCGCGWVSVGSSDRNDKLQKWGHKT
jgi:hypothetical protein